MRFSAQQNTTHAERGARVESVSGVREEKSWLVGGGVIILL